MSTNPVADAVEEARKVLQQAGYVVLREGSYRRAQERQRVAEALCEYADERRESYERWVRDELGPEIRRLRERLTFVYGVARAHGATVEELSAERQQP